MSRRISLVLLLLFAGASTVGAHPVPKANHDRTLVIRLTPEAVIIDYRLELDEYRAHEDLKKADDVDLEEIDNRKDFHATFRRYHAGVLGNNLVATLDGKELEFTCIYQQHQVLDHVRCDYRFRAPWKLSSDKPNRFTFYEGNYERDAFSLLYVSLDASPQLTLRDVIAPDDELLRRPPDKRKPGDEDRLRKVSATVLVIQSSLPGVVRPALPPDPEELRHAASRRWRKVAGRSKPVPSFPVGTERPPPPAGEVVGQSKSLLPDPPLPEAESKPTSGHSRLLDLLLDTRQGLAVLLLLAAGFGAAHALTPGHGKTLVAAYLIGQRGTVWHAFVLGGVTALTHTGGVILLAILLALYFRDVSPGAIQSALSLVGGLLVTGLGAWLFLQRLTGRPDHIHLGGGHHHHEPSAPSPDGARATWWQIVVLGISGGIVPCWDAILLLTFSLSRLWLGVLLLLAFSVGLAGVLVVLGIVVVRGGEAARARLGDQERFQKVVKALPILSAAVITVLGLVLTFAAARSAP
jgi:ABC-type nickel/cobalt efflux system permease component RcnA